MHKAEQPLRRMELQEKKKKSTKKITGYSKSEVEPISGKLCRFLFMFSTGFTSLSILLLFPLSIIFFSFVHGFLFDFI